MMTTTNRTRRIDVHHHFFPASLNKGNTNIKLGWRTPEGILPWTPEVSFKVMDTLRVDMAILSLPPTPSKSIGPEDRAVARERNVFLSDLCKEHPTRFGFFASLPALDDIEGSVAELRYAFDELDAYGIALPSSCGHGSDTVYIGDDRYDPIWQELNLRSAVVILHGTPFGSSTPYPHPFLGIPITEVPNETFKAAAHLVVTGNKRQYPEIKIILVHLGGTTVSLAPRVAVLSRHMGCTLTVEEILADFKSFYYDTALSAYDTNLIAVESFVQPDHILFGTDCPAVSAEMAHWYAQNLEDFYAKEPEKLKDVMYRNALKLFPRLRDSDVENSL